MRQHIKHKTIKKMFLKNASFIQELIRYEIIIASLKKKI